MIKGIQKALIEALRAKYIFEIPIVYYIAK
jgi:hypothetical protein